MPPEVGPRLVVLLVASPLIGALLVGLFGRRSAELARHLAVANRWLTAIIGSLTVGAFLLPETGPEAANAFSVLIPWWELPNVGSNQGRPLAFGVLSFGLDRLNLAPLLTIPWLALIADDADPPPSTTTHAVLLLLESALLATFAAFDALTFLSAGALTIGLVGLHLGWYGHEDRRMIAESFWRSQSAAHALWAVGLIGAAVSAAWARQELIATIPPVDFRWTALARGLPQIVVQSEAAFQYWMTAAPLLFALMLSGCLLRGPWMPFQRGLRRWFAAVPTTSVPLLVGVWPLIAGYGWLRFVAPMFGDQVSSVMSALAWWTAISGILAARQCWMATDLRQFASGWCWSLQSLGWMGLIIGGPSGLSAGWLMLQAAGWSTAGWVLLNREVRQHSSGNRLPAALIAVLCVAPIVTIPIWGGETAPVRTLLIRALEPTGLAVVGWFITGWAAIRRVASIARANSQTSSNPVEGDDPGPAGVFWLPLLGCLLLIVLVPALLWGGR